MLSSVRTEIEMAQILGYGKKADFKPICDQVKSIEQKSAGGKCQRRLKSDPLVASFAD